MSTYTDLHNRAKETLNVDYHTRVTPQKVHFVNPENTYCGTFAGEIKTNGNNTIVGGTIANVVLSNSVLDKVEFKNGIKLDDIKQAIAELSAADVAIDASIEATNLSLATEISDRKFAVDVEVLERTNADEKLSTDLTKSINFESEQSKSRDAALDEKIENEIKDRADADVTVMKQVNDKMLHDRHLEMHLIDNREFPLNIHDYAVNTYVDSNANAYVYKKGNDSDYPIGKIEKAVFTDGKLVSFEFNAFANHPDTYELTAAGIFQYTFDADNNVRYTGVGGYRLSYDVAKSSTLENIQLVLDSANNNGYYDVNFKGSLNKAATVDANYKTDDAGMISSCALTITSEQLSNFALTTPFKFTANGETKTFKGRNGNWCEATLSDNVFSLYDKHTTRYFIPVRDADTGNLYARVYDGNVLLSYDGSLEEVGVDVDGGRHYRLNVENGFKLPFDSLSPYVKISYSEADNIIQVKEEKKYYKYSLNGNTGHLIPGIADIPNKRIDDAYATVGVTLNVDSPSLAKYVNDDYVLELVDAANKYQVEKQIFEDNFGKIKLTFIKDIRALFVDIMPTATADFIHLRFDINNIIAPTEIDESRVLFTSKKLCDDIKHARLDEKILDERYDFKYELVPDLVNKHYSGESKVLISQAMTEKKDTLTLLMPDKKKQIPGDSDIASCKFILNFKVFTESLQDESFVTLLIRSADAVDKFYYMNKEVRRIFIKKNKWSTLQFEEIRPHRYIINDLDYSEIDWRLKWLHNELSTHELSSYNTMMKLSDDIEFLLSVQYDDMSYKGTLPYLSAESWIDTEGKTQYNKVDLSAFIAQSPFIHDNYIKLGDMFKLSVAQKGVDILYDRNGKYNYLGEDDYFVINTKYVKVEDVEWTQLDIFRNAETETKELSAQLTAQINDTSSYIVTEVDRISAELSTELCCYELSVNGISVEVDRISAELNNELKNCELSVNGISVEVDRISAELSNELSVIEHHYNKTLSCNIELTHVKTPDIGPDSHIRAIVDKLLIVDEITFDLYALTIRNGALNINKVKTIDKDYHVTCCK